MKHRFSGMLFTGLLLAQNAFALTEGAERLVFFETRVNAVASRNNEAIPMPHYEIPLNLLDVDFSNRMSDEVKKHFIFEKDGQKYVRWVLNPEDTKWFSQVSEHIKEKGITLSKEYYFTGYQTASRSYIVEDPGKTMQFSVKSSTDKTGGYWADKKQPVGEAIDSRLNADFLDYVQKKLRFEHAIILDEPAILKLPAIDQAVVFRDLNALNNPSSDKVYLPGFSALHDSVGREIAFKNGSKDPYAFWTEHYIKATGRALGELAARTGMQFDSPHSQNFLVEMDANLKPTGRIVLRDLADLYIYEKFARRLHPEADKYFKSFSQKGNILDHIAAGFGPLHGNTAPKWVDASQYSQWKDVFFNEFELTFEKITGLEKQDYKHSSTRNQNGQYFGAQYKIEGRTERVGAFWQNIHKYASPKGILNCSQVLL